MAGFDNDVVYGINVDFSGGSPVSAKIISDGQLLIGSTAQPNIRVGNLTSSDNSITITNGSGTIDLSNTFQPNSVIQLFDDFFPSNNKEIGQLVWNQNIVNPIQADSTSTNPGICQISGNPQSGIVLSDGTGASGHHGIVVGGGIINLNFITKIGTLSDAINRYTCFIGLSDDLDATGTITNGIFFTYSDNVNAGKWVINCENASVTTSVNTNIVADTNFHNFGIIINSNASSVSFTIDGVSVGSAITTNIPVAPQIAPYFAFTQTLGLVNPIIYIDLFYMLKKLTISR